MATDLNSLGILKTSAGVIEWVAGSRRIGIMQRRFSNFNFSAIRGVI